MHEIYVPLPASLAPAEYAKLVKDVFLSILYFRSQSNHHPLSKQHQSSSTEPNSAADPADQCFSTAITPELFSTAPISFALVIGTDILNPLEVYRINLSISPSPPPPPSSSITTTTTSIMKKVIRDLTILQSLPLPPPPSKPTTISLLLLLHHHQHTTIPQDFIVQRQFNPHGSRKTKVCINLVMGQFNSNSNSDENNNSNKDKEEEGGVWLQCATSFKGSL